VALAARPQLLLLDEPAAGLAGPERADLMQLVKRLAGQGMAVLYTEHNMDAVAGVADRVLVLIEGRLAAQGSFDEMRVTPWCAAATWARRAAKGQAMLEVDNSMLFTARRRRCSGCRCRWRPVNWWCCRA
jgi:ABC-type multidrug transport system ATPase subunit